MAQAVTLELPHTLYLPAKRMAEATNRPLKELLVRALQASLPPLNGLPPELIDDLSQLESLDDRSLREVMLSTVPEVQQRELERLLRKDHDGNRIFEK